MRFAVACIGHSRPEMWKYSTRALAKCRRADEIDVYMFVDGGGMRQDRAVKLAAEGEGKFASGPHLIFRPRNWGLSKNILEALRECFNAGYDVVCLLEDDVIPSRDFLELHFYCHEEFDHEKHKIFSVVGYTKNKLDTGDMGKSTNVVRLQQWYSPDGVSFSRRIWNKIGRYIDDRYYKNPLGMTNKLKAGIKRAEPGFIKKQWAGGKYKHSKQAGYLQALRAWFGMYCLVPCVSRCQDIGFYGVHQRQKRHKGERLLGGKNWKRSPWYSRCFEENRSWDQLMLVGKNSSKEFVVLQKGGDRNG